MSAVKVGSDYSDAVFSCSSSRSVLRGSVLHGRMLLVGLRHLDETVQGIHVWRSYSFLSDHTSSFGLQPKHSLHLRLWTDAVLFANLARLFSSIRFAIALGRVIIYFSVAKLVCSRVRLKSLGQWRSFTNLPLSSLWF